MTDTQAVASEEVAPQTNSKEYNFRQQEAMYMRKLEDERNARLELEKQVQQLSAQRQQTSTDDDDDDEPYVDNKKLKRKLESFEKTLEKKIEQKAEQKAAMMIESERRNQYLRENSDFNSVMNESLMQKFADTHPRLAENILRMPEGFERQKLVYENIKALGLDKPEKKSSIQDKIDANARNPYYMPSHIGSGSYEGGSDFSATGQKAAYEKMQALKNRLSLG